MTGNNDAMTSSHPTTADGPLTAEGSGPTYYTPSYGLPSREAPVTGSGAVTPAWQAPGSSTRGKLEWEPLRQRDTPYPWEESRPPEAWLRHRSTVPEGPLPTKPAPMPAPEPAAPLPPTQIDQPEVDEWVRRATDRRGAPAAPEPTVATTGRIPYPKEQRQRPQPRSKSSPQQPGNPDFPPPTGAPVAAHRNRRPSTSGGGKKGGLPWIQLVLTGLVLFEPAAALIPLIGALLLIVTSKQYRNPSARVAWGVVVIALTVALLVVRAIVA